MYFLINFTRRSIVRRIGAMKNPDKYLKHTRFLLFLLVISNYQAFAFEPQAFVLPHLEIIIPGVTRTITVTQEDLYPQGIYQMAIVTIGYGGITIAMIPSETLQEGSLLMLEGMGISSSGIVPVLKFGKTDGTLTASVETGSERSPLGFVWLSSWVYSTAYDPPFEYQLSITAYGGLSGAGDSHH
jgi:hypothetical protein